MEKIVEAFSSIDDLIAGQGVSAEVITQAENALNVCFSKEYRAYLSSFGVAAVNGHELTGLGASSRVNVVEVTDSISKSFGISIESAYVVENDNIDGVVYWQRTSGEVLRTVRDSEPKKVAGSLLEYVML